MEGKKKVWSHFILYICIFLIFQIFFSKHVNTYYAFNQKMQFKK